MLEQNPGIVSVLEHFRLMHSPVGWPAVDCVTCVVERGILVQGKERGIEQHCVVVFHNNPLVLRLDPWLVLIG